MRFPIYLDNAATTAVDPRVTKAMTAWLTEKFGNPSSSHAFGREARAAVENARQQVAGLINAEPHEIVWTSGATESDNLAIKGVAAAHPTRGCHLITLRTEHKAVLDTLDALAHAGFETTVLEVEPTGLANLDSLQRALRPDTALVSVMMVNNEIGVIQDVAAIGEICRQRDVLLHVDAAQATGKVAIDVKRMNVGLMSLTAHKTYGPKGIGALYVRSDLKARLNAQMHGGGHEFGLRSGTLATHQIVGLGECLHIAGSEMASETQRIRALRDLLYTGLSRLDGVKVNGDMQQRIAHNLNFSLALPHAEEIIASLTDIAVSSSAACVGSGPSHVLMALGNSEQLASNAIRISVGRFNTSEEVDFAVDYLHKAISRQTGNVKS